MSREKETTTCGIRLESEISQEDEKACSVKWVRMHAYRGNGEPEYQGNTRMPPPGCDRRTHKCFLRGGNEVILSNGNDYFGSLCSCPDLTPTINGCKFPFELAQFLHG
jgi:hypothetical protein